MDIKDYHMTAEELAQLTKYLALAIAEQIDWDLVEKRILELYGSINDDQKAAIHQLIEESKEDNSVTDVFEEHLEDVTDLYQDLLDDENQEESKEE